MKLLKVVCLLLALGLVVVGCSSSSGSSPQTVGTRTGDIATEFELESIGGNRISLSGLRGKPVLINFWTIACPYCREEMPYLQQVYQDWTANGLIYLWTINVGDNPDSITQFLQENKLSLPVLMDRSKSVATDYGLPGVPVTFLIDKDGVIRNVKLGAYQSKAEIENSLNTIIRK